MNRLPHLIFSSVLVFLSACSQPAAGTPVAEAPTQTPTVALPTDTPEPTPTPSPTPQPTPMGGGGEWIAFTSMRDGNPEIYKMRLDGSEATRLTDNPAVDAYADWSPDGTKILFSSDRDGKGELYVMNADGSDSQRLTQSQETGGSIYGVWSPDGKRIAFSASQPGGYSVAVIDADGSNLTLLTPPQSYGTLPTWSPDGSEIAFVSPQSGAYDLYVMNADGSDPQALQIFKGTDWDAMPAKHQTIGCLPRWSPDGSRLLVCFHNELLVMTGYLKSDELFVVNADGSGLTQLTDDDTDEYAPTWSPDGSTIAFAAVKESIGQICFMKADGSDVHCLETGTSDDFPAWQPVGN